MNKSSKMRNEFKESDFKEIREMLINSLGLTYSTNYIRRVLSLGDKRKNTKISKMADQYRAIKIDFENRLKNTNQNH